MYNLRDTIQGGNDIHKYRRWLMDAVSRALNTEKQQRQSAQHSRYCGSGGTTISDVNVICDVVGEHSEATGHLRPNSTSTDSQ